MKLRTATFALLLCAECGISASAQEAPASDLAATWSKYSSSNGQIAFRLPCKESDVRRKSLHGYADVEETECVLYHGYSYGVSIMSNGVSFDAMVEEFRHSLGEKAVTVFPFQGRRAAWAVEKDGIYERLVEVSDKILVLMEVVRVVDDGSAAQRSAHLMENARVFEDTLELPK